MKRIDPREIANLDVAVATAVAALPKLVPMTTSVGGVPEPVYDENDEIVMVEVIL